MKGWLPRRLGGGLGGTRRGGNDVNVRHSGRDDGRRGGDDRRRKSRSRSRDRKKRSRSRDRKRRSKSRERKRSRSRDRKRVKRSRSRSRDRRRRERGDSANGGDVAVKEEPVDNGYEDQVNRMDYAAAMAVKQEKEEGARRPPLPPEA